MRLSGIIILLTAMVQDLTNGNLIDVSNYENGVRTGKSVSFDENGNIVVSVYENGEKISEFLVDAEV